MKGVGPKDVGKRVQYGDQVGTLLAYDGRWMNPASPPWERKYEAQAWVKFQGKAEAQIHPRFLERTGRRLT